MDITVDGAVVVLEGPLDGRCTAAVREVIYDLLNTQDTNLVLDMHDVTWIDAVAVRMLAVATRRAEREGHFLVLRGCRPDLRRTLRRSRTAHLLDIEASGPGVGPDVRTTA